MLLLLPAARPASAAEEREPLDEVVIASATLKDLQVRIDGLEDAYDKGRLMGTFAEDCAQSYRFTREEQDRFAIASLERAQKANTEGWFDWEIAPVSIKAGKEDRLMKNDEQPFKANIAKIPALKPVFRKDGSVTEAHVIRSIALLDQAALDAVKQWRYTPTTLNGVPVPVIMTVTVNFTLQ